jgi:hypothetical protein
VRTPPGSTLRIGICAMAAKCFRPNGVRSYPSPSSWAQTSPASLREVAHDVEGVSVGDAVFSMVRFPSFGDSKCYAKYVTVPASECALKPAGVSHIHAAAAPMSLLTAWQFLIELGHEVANPLQPELHRPVPLKGKRVLINGAAGGVGHFAVQIAKMEGAYVIAVASTKHEAFLRGLGADEFIDYKKTAPEDVVRVPSLGGLRCGHANHVCTDEQGECSVSLSSASAPLRIIVFMHGKRLPTPSKPERLAALKKRGQIR